MRTYLIRFILWLNTFFPKKDHPFNTSKQGVMDLNYTDFEYNHTPSLLDLYSRIIDIDIFQRATVLDIWCWGWGKSLYIAEHYNAQVTWVDITPTFITAAKKESKIRGLDNKCSFILEDIFKNNLAKESFDIIILSDVLEHIPNTKELLTECYKLLTPWGVILFDFAPYYHYFGHHIWDTLPIPWLHVFTTEKFRISLYKESVAAYMDGDKRINLRIGKSSNGREEFSYLNRLTRKQFEHAINSIVYTHNCEYSEEVYMLKNIDFLSKIPFLRELWVRHIVGSIKKPI